MSMIPCTNTFVKCRERMMNNNSYEEMEKDGKKNLSYQRRILLREHPESTSSVERGVGHCKKPGSK